MPRVYLALGDSMSIDRYTGVEGGGAARQFFHSLGSGWTLVDRSRDGCRMQEVPTKISGDLITLTIGGNDLMSEMDFYLYDDFRSFRLEHRALLQALRGKNPEACLIVGTIYAPQRALAPELHRGLERVNAIIGENVAEVGGRLADIHAAFLGRERELLCCNIEPNLAGARAIAGLFGQCRQEAGRNTAPRGESSAWTSESTLQ